MKRKELLKKGVSIGLASILSVSMLVPTAAEEQTVSQEAVVEENSLEMEAEVSTDDSETAETEDAQEQNESESSEVTENQEETVEEESAESEENAVSVQAADATNSFEIEGTVLKKYTGTGGAVTIPDSVTEIASGAFEEQKEITSVTLGKNVETIGYNAFNNCTNLKAITWNSKIKTINDLAFSGTGLTSLRLPASVTELGSDVFWFCRNLTEVVYESDADISYDLFKSCNKLKTVTILGKPSVIGVDAFYGDESLEKINIPDSVTSLGMTSFGECSSLVSLHLPDSITSLHDSLFYNCTSLTSLYMPRYLTDCYDHIISSCPNLTVYIHAETTVAIEWAEKNGIKYEIIDESKPYSVEYLKAVPYGKNKTYISWDKVENADGYLVYGKHGSDGKYGYIGMTTKNNYYVDKKALDTDYNFYWVYPYKLDNDGNKVINTSCKYVYAKGVCASVTNLKATNQKGSVKLSWTKSSDAEGYLIYGKTASGKYGYIGMTSKTSYTDKKASKAEYNFYWVYPYYKNAESKMIVGQTGKYVYGKAK